MTFAECKFEAEVRDELQKLVRGLIGADRTQQIDLAVTKISALRAQCGRERLAAIAESFVRAVGEDEGEDTADIIAALPEALNTPLWRVLQEIGGYEDARALAAAASVATRLNVDCHTAVTAETPLGELLA